MSQIRCVPVVQSQNTDNPLNVYAITQPPFPPKSTLGFDSVSRPRPLPTLLRDLPKIAKGVVRERPDL